MSLDVALVSSAIVVWTGWGKTSWPSRDENRLVEVFGSDMAAELLPRLRELEDEFYASDERFVVADLGEMGDAAAEQFRRVHPELSEDAIRAFAWCYTYDYK
ncbi:MAG: hypothetical protein ACYCO9_23235 [Streptosporangiaceae bacterium]